MYDPGKYKYDVFAFTALFFDYKKARTVDELMTIFSRFSRDPGVASIYVANSETLVRDGGVFTYWVMAAEKSPKSHGIPTPKLTTSATRIQNENEIAIRPCLFHTARRHTWAAYG